MSSPQRTAEEQDLHREIKALPGAVYMVKSVGLVDTLQDSEY